MTTINTVELEEYNKMLDNILDNIESGHIVANPLKKNLDKVTADTVKVESTATELGEDEMVEKAAVKTPEINSINLDNINPGTVLQVELTENENTFKVLQVYNNAVEASTALNIHQTTVRKYAKLGTEYKGVTLVYFNENHIYV